MAKRMLSLKTWLTEATLYLSSIDIDLEANSTLEAPNMALWGFVAKMIKAAIDGNIGMYKK